jgi:hypothetical protein
MTAGAPESVLHIATTQSRQSARMSGMEAKYGKWALFVFWLLTLVCLGPQTLKIALKSSGTVTTSGKKQKKVVVKPGVLPKSLLHVKPVLQRVGKEGVVVPNRHSAAAVAKLDGKPSMLETAVKALTNIREDQVLAFGTLTPAILLATNNAKNTTSKSAQLYVDYCGELFRLVEQHVLTSMDSSQNGNSSNKRLNPQCIWLSEPYASYPLAVHTHHTTLTNCRHCGTAY